MLLGMLGNIPLGGNVFTGPIGQEVKRKNDIVQHEVVSGKPVVQYMGQALDTKTLEFYFCETFCNPTAEWGKLYMAYQSRSPMALVLTGGPFTGLKYTVESLSDKTEATTRGGRISRISATMELLEAPLMSGLAFSLPSPATIARAVLNPLTRK